MFVQCIYVINKLVNYLLTSLAYTSFIKALADLTVLIYKFGLPDGHITSFGFDSLVLEQTQEILHLYCRTLPTFKLCYKATLSYTCITEYATTLPQARKKNL